MKQPTGLNLVIIYMNMLSASVAAVVNLTAGILAPRDWRPIRLAVGVLSVVYVVGYIALLSGAVTIEGWSELFRGISPFAWWLVWIAPAWKGGRLWADVKEIERRVESGRK